MRNIKTAFALIRQNDKILLIQEGCEPSYGKWCLPGGHVKKDESLRAAAAREVFEETGGLEVTVGDVILSEAMDNSKYSGRPEEDGMTIQVSIFKADISGGKIDISKLTEELDARWFTTEEINKLPLRWDWLKELL